MVNRIDRNELDKIFTAVEDLADDGCGGELVTVQCHFHRIEGKLLPETWQAYGAAFGHTGWLDADELISAVERWVLKRGIGNEPNRLREQIAAAEKTIEQCRARLAALEAR